MRSSELRIGNLVKVDSNPFESVTQIFKDGVVTDAYDVVNSFKDLEPIPLTEEWLVKFGFEKSIDGFEMSKDITIRNNNGWVKEMVFFQIDDGLCGVSLRDIYDCGEKETYVIEIDIEYVHQLQNLFWCLTGKELTIKE